MSNFSAKSNWSKGELASGILIDATSFTLASGQGALFPATGVGNYFWGVFFDQTKSSPFKDTSREIVKCYRASADTFTITNRAQEGTSAKAWNTSDNFMLTLTSATINEIEDAVDTKVIAPATNTADYIPQWNGANSKTLKDGLAVPDGGLAGLTALGNKLESSAFSDTGVTGKLITGFSSGAGAVAGTDTILQAINKLDGNIGAKSPLASPTFTTQITTPSVLATANDSGAIGASGTAFSDLFLASGGVINWNDGNATLTHSAGLLTSNVPLTATAFNATASDGTGNLAVITNTDATNYSRIKYVGTVNAFSSGVGNGSATIADLVNKFYIYDFTNSKVAMTIIPNTLAAKFYGAVEAVGAVTGSNLSGTNTGDNAANSTADMLLGTVQAVTAEKKFTNSKLTILGSSTGKNTFTMDNSSASDYVTTIPAVTGTVALGTGTANEIAYWSATNTLGTLAVATYPSLTELSYVKGVTSAIQTQIGNKAPLANPTFTGTVILPKTIEIQDTSADHQYVLAVSELTADRTVTLPLLTGADEFVFKDHAVTLTNKTFTGATVQSGYTDLDLPASDHTANGTCTNAILSGATVAAFNLVMMGTGGKWILVDADAIATCKGLMAIALEAKNDTEAMLVALPNSFVRDDTWNWTVGDTLYASETAGGISNAIPTGADGVVKPIGVAISADVIYFNPSLHQSTVVA